MKRAFALGAAVFAIALVPAAAQAYPAPSVPITVSDATPAVNDPVTVTITGLESAQSATSTTHLHPRLGDRDRRRRRLDEERSG